MTEEQTFLQAITTAPDDDAPRLIYADWLEERGDPRGEFIRIQCCLASMPENDPQRVALQRREDNLLNQHRATWEGPLRQICKAASVTFQRGLPETIKISSANFLAHADQLFTLAASPHLKNLTTLDLEYNRIGNAGIRALAASPHLKNLTMLNLDGNEVGDAGVQALAASPHLKNLTALNLGYNTIGPEGALALAASPHLKNLTMLKLFGNEVGDAGAQALAASPHLKNLTTLDLWDTYIGNAGAVAFATSPNLKNLTRLNLRYNYIGNAGARSLAASPHLKNLTMLNLDGNNIGEQVLTGIQRDLAARSAVAGAAPGRGR